MASAGEWSTIESDPGVFTELIKSFGVDGLQVEELYCLDFEQLKEFKWVKLETNFIYFSMFRPIYGLIFLFKYRSGEEISGKLDYTNKNIYFSQQVISNACATQAIVNLLLNLDSVPLGSMLDNFRSFSKELDPPVRV
jgi:ubiquitin carboxyl-terminal hydrolase L5